MSIVRANKAQLKIGTIESFCYPVRSHEISHGKVRNCRRNRAAHKVLYKARQRKGKGKGKGKGIGDYALRQALFLTACLESIRSQCVVFCSARHTRVPLESLAVLTHGQADSWNAGELRGVHDRCCLAACQFRRMTPATTTLSASRE